MGESGGGAAKGGGGGGEPVRVPSAPAVGGRLRFEVELKPGETTIVSWKKFLKDAAKANKQISAPHPPAVVHPAIEANIATVPPAENDANDAPPASRLSSVIEKIERLYMGKNSSDEEDLNDVPDDDEYDTEDSFIDDTELDEYFQVDNSAIKHDGFFVNRGKLERTTNEPVLSLNQQPKKRRRKELTKGPNGNDDGDVPNKQLKVRRKNTRMSVPGTGNNATTLPHVVALPSVYRSEDMKLKIMSSTEKSAKKSSVESRTTMDPSPVRIVPNPSGTVEEKVRDKRKTKTYENKLKDASVCTDPLSQRPNERNSTGQSKSPHGRLMSNADELDKLTQRKEKNYVHDQSDVSAPEGKNSLQNARLMYQKTPPVQRKEGSSVKQKGSMLDKAIKELEKIVAESRPPNMEVSDADISSQAVKKRMPPEIKQKLAKVARIAQASHGKITKELLNRLMSIVGHLIQIRSLRRNLINMVNSGLSAKEEKDAKLQQIKKEIDEMVKVRIPLMKSKAMDQHTGSSDDFQETGDEAKDIFKSKFSIDDALEDRICDLYDLYVDGLDEDAAPQVRKLYAELAELWPKGFMDNHGIKRAICRAKDRKRVLYTRHKNEGKIKRKKSLLTKTEEPVRVESNTVSHPQLIQDKLVIGSSKHNKQAPSTTSAVARIPSTTSNGPAMDLPKHEKLTNAISTNPNETVRTKSEVLVKKKTKRKPELALAEAHGPARPEKLTAVQREEKQKTQKQIVGSTTHKSNLQPTVSSSLTSNAVAVQMPPPSSENLN